MVRYLKEGKDGRGGREDYEHIVFVGTKLDLNGNWILKTYDLRWGDIRGSPSMERGDVGYDEFHIHRPNADIISCDMCIAVL